MRRPERQGSGRIVNCAVYTRKSSEDGLEQDFNSLDAQREACEASINSQRGEGWRILPQRYDDGGLSGGTMERPALQQLLADVRSGRADVVVVYKIDRLTRSLFDFARIVEILDERGASFVSVTQQFNTTTSMGRLTLNVLLSFAQFEREITGERIRDKIAASKRKGMWMGGNVPLGYDARDRSLAINEQEAETVRFIFRRYSELGSVRLLKQELDGLGIVSKRRTGGDGEPCGGQRFSKGALYHLLSNRIYRGEIVHKGVIHPGLHEPIIDEALWSLVERQLASNRHDRETGANAAHPSLLTGRISDSSGCRMTPSHSTRRGVRYRYYASIVEESPTENGDLSSSSRSMRPARAVLRLPAGDVEALVGDRVRQLLMSPLGIGDALAPLGFDAPTQRLMLDRAERIAADWPSAPSSERQTPLRRTVRRVDADAAGLTIHIDRQGLAAILAGGTCKKDDPAQPLAAVDRLASAPDIIVRADAALTRRRQGVRMIYGEASAGKADRELEMLLREAFTLRSNLLAGSDDSIEAMACRLGLPKGHIPARLRLTWLCPTIVKAILQGRHPAHLTRSRLLSMSQDLPLLWSRQREYLGFRAD